MRIKKRLAPIVTAVLVVALCSGGVSAGVAAQAEENSDNILRIPVGGGGVIDSMNPFTMLNQASFDLAQIQYESLVMPTAPDGADGPGLAEKWTVDGTTWTFELRPDLKWSDGEDLTAEDVAWNYNTIMTNPKLAISNGNLGDNLVSVTALDEDTIEIVTKTPQAINPGKLYIVPKHIWADMDSPETYENTKDVVGSGPFVMSAYSRGVSAHMRANPYNWRGAPKLDGIEVISYKNKDAEVLALKSGEIDWSNRLTASQFDTLTGAENIEPVETGGGRYLGLSMNVGSTTLDGTPMGNGAAVLQDVVVRKAIRQALDTQQLVDKVLGGHGWTGPEILGPPTKPYYSDYKDIADPYSPDAANEALDSAGYTKGADGYRVDKDGKPINLRLTFDGSGAAEPQIASFIEPWLKEIGIKVTLMPQSIDQRDQERHSGNYDLTLNGWGNPIDPDYMLYINTCGSRAPAADGAGNGSADNWCDPEFDELYKKQHVELDQDKRTKLVQEALSLHYKAAVVAVLYYPAALQAYRTDRIAHVTKIQNDFTAYQDFHDLTLVGQEEGASSSSPSEEGMSWPWIVAIAALVIVAGGVTVIVIRRRQTATDRE